MSEPIESLRKSVDNFSMAMGAKLIVNNEKMHWRNCTLEHLLSEFDKNVRALKRAVETNQSHTVILGKAANVANFAMMIAERNNK
ncbi:hypothetical protein LCGC14_2175940 [marine sediment metagenome]|uniref:Uncharacterized protein n=1 Tax=marine sediment metagenome TaxID=412755 RepID=A0A0F9GJI8_9ZZZZ